MIHDVSMIGLGVMGQRMLTNMSAHDRFNVVAAWDPDPQACAHTRERFGHVRIARDAADAIGDAGSTVVYVAAPPASHREHALAAFAAGKGVYCEKPLGVDVDESRELVSHAEASGQVGVVNFTLASAAATQAVEPRLAQGALGELTGVDIRLHFSQWPRAWQMGAEAWLSRRAEGGFVREVLSHWIYLSERLFGPLMLESHWVAWPGDDRSETHVLAGLRAGALPVTVAGSVGGAGPDLVEFTVWGERESFRIHDWNRLRISDGSEWVERLTDLDDPREVGYRLQLDNAAAAFAGEAHSMPSFADALSVQITVERILGAAPEAR